jgi:histidine triad (HIT) family protein
MAEAPPNPYKGNDFYCDVALKGEVELVKEYESDSVLAFRHTRKRYPVHIIVIPKRHISSLLTLTKDEDPILLELVETIKTIAAKVTKENGAARVLTNLGEYQDSKHLHFHITYGDQIW